MSDPGRGVLSIVVPTLNEAGWLPATLAAARAGAVDGGADEVVVSDSGSHDGTLEVARRLGARCVAHPAVAPGRGADERPAPSRAAACNRGAAAARGSILLFLDADVRLPHGWDRAVRRALEDRGTVGGGFHLTLDGPEPGLRRVERVNRLRYRLSHLFYGDQAVFVRATAFAAAGGFPEVPVLESARLCRRLKAEGRLVLLDLAVAASARRFQRGGVGRVFRRDLAIWARSLLRLGPGAAGRRYWHDNRRPYATDRRP